MLFTKIIIINNDDNNKKKSKPNSMQFLFIKEKGLELKPKLS